MPLSKSDHIFTEENFDRDISKDDLYLIDVSDPLNEQLINKKDTASTSGPSFKVI